MEEPLTPLLVLESQLPRKSVNFLFNITSYCTLFTITSMNINLLFTFTSIDIELTVLWGS